MDRRTDNRVPSGKDPTVGSSPLVKDEGEMGHVRDKNIERAVQM